MTESITRIYQSESIAELATALALAQAEMKHAAKSNTNPYFKSKYSALPDIMDAARPYLSKNGLSISQITDFDNVGMFLITQLLHKSGQWLRSWYPVTPVKNDPQGLGSALTYARRYSYASIVGVAASDEDDDGNAASGNISATTGDITSKQAYGSNKLMKAKFEEIAGKINSCNTDDELTKLFKSYEVDFSNFKAIDTTIYDNLCQLGSIRSNSILNAEMNQQMDNAIGE